jgi:hypothetical protein
VRRGALGRVRVFGSGVVSCFICLFCSHQSFCFLLSEGTMGSRWELHHLAGLPGGGGVFRLCHTLVGVNTV